MNVDDNTIKDIRKKIGMTQEEFSNYFDIPIRTIQNWETNSDSRREPPSYLIELIVYKLKKEGKI